MPKPKRLSGQDAVRVLEKFGFSIESQKGSHVKLVRMATSARQVLIVPSHKELTTGAVVAIFRQATRYISEEELRPYFYSP